MKKVNSAWKKNMREATVIYNTNAVSQVFVDFLFCHYPSEERCPE
jgi:hypothetical protein